MKIIDSILAMGGRAAKPDTALANAPTAGPTPTPPTTDEREEILAFIRQFFGPVKTRMNHFELQPMPPAPVEIFGTVARQCGPLYSSEELAKARLLGDDWKQAAEAINAHGRDREAAAHSAHLTEVAKDTLAGKGGDAYNKQDFREDFASRRVALKIRCREISVEAIAIFAPGASKVVEALKKHAEDCAVEEFRRFSGYGLSYRPSLLVETLLAAASNLEGQIAKLVNQQSIMGNDPRKTFGLLGIEL